MASDRINGGGVSSAPPYPHRHNGPVLVCGFAWNLIDDVTEARKRYPSAPIIAVNGAAGAVKAQLLYSQHPLRMPKWISQQRQRFGDGFEVHAAGKAHRATKMGVIPPMPWVDYYWDGIGSNGTSTWGARKLAASMGFDLVVLCGMPLEVGRYADGRGSKSFSQQQVVEHYRKKVERDIDWHPGCHSMSGWTRELLGAP